MRNFLELQCLVDDLVDFLELLMLSMLTFNVLFDEVKRGPGEENKFFFLTCHWNGIIILLFLKKCYRWLKLITCSSACREYTVAKKMTMYKRDD